MDPRLRVIRVFALNSLMDLSGLQMVELRLVSLGLGAHALVVTVGFSRGVARVWALALADGDGETDREGMDQVFEWWRGVRRQVKEVRDAA